jgi:beta-glucanase (GH16 family)
MRRLLIRVLAVSSIAALCLLCPLTIVRPAGATPPGYSSTPDWSDEFDHAYDYLPPPNNALPNPGIWNIKTYQDGGGQNTMEAVKVSGGVLTITTYTEDTVHKSGTVDTNGKYMPPYGYIEASIDFDGSSGMFSTFWLWSNNMNSSPFNQPHTFGTEMDIAEHSLLVGSQNTDSLASTTLHWDGYPDTNPLGHKTVTGGLHSGWPDDPQHRDLSIGFHTYGLEWTPDVENYYYDGHLVWTVNDSPGDPSVPGQPWWPSVLGPVSHTNQFILLSSQVGGSNGVPGGCWCGNTLASYNTLGGSTTKMKVEYVKHYMAVVSKVVDLCAVGSASTTMQVSWTAPADRMPLAQYDLRYSTLPIVDGGASQGQTNFNAATSIPTLAPHSQGSVELMQVTGLSTCTTYYFALKTKDVVGNWSLMSNVSGGTTQGCGHPVSGLGRTEQVADIIQCGGGAAPGPVKIDESSLSFSAPSPNPARGATSFLISVPAGLQGAKLRVDVFDVAGRRVRSLVDRIASQGTAPVEWNLLSDLGRRVSSGMYMVRVDIGDTRKTFPLLVLR